MYRPTTSQNFASNALSPEILKRRVRCGFRSFARHSRETVLFDTPASMAIVRTDQRASPFAGRFTPVMTLSTFAGGRLGLRPRPEASSSPASPERRNRAVHFETQFPLHPNCLATASCPRPPARSRTTDARRCARLLVFGEDIRLSSSRLSPSETAGAAIGRPRFFCRFRMGGERISQRAYICKPIYGTWH